MTNSAAQAYGSVAKQIASPRELEAQLLLKAAARLQAIQDDWDHNRPALDQALLYNRKLWTILVSSVADPAHQLPAAIRQNVANLGLFVFKQSLNLVQQPRPDLLKSLIFINRELAAGLLGRA